MQVLTYTASGVVRVKADEGGCRGGGNFPITNGLLIVSRNLANLPGMPVGETYGFTVGSDSELTLSCPKGASRPMGKIAGMDALDASNMTRIQDIELLKDTGEIKGNALSWSFKAIDEAKP